MSNILDAIVMLYEKMGLSFDCFQEDVKAGYLTINTGRSGKDILYYLDSEKECALYVDDLLFLSPKDIEKEIA